MASAIASESLAALAADPVQLKAVVDGVDSCLAMCNAKARCVGVSTIPVRDPGSVTGIIGVHGEVSGFITVNMTEQVAVALVSALLQEPLDTLDEAVIDGVGEITNIVAGGVKRGLSGSAWAFGHVTVPSVIVGQNYHIAYSRGLSYLAVTFEYQDVKTLLLDHRLIQVAISLIRL